MNITINKSTGLLTQSSAIQVPKQGISHKPIDGPDAIIIHYTAGTSAQSAVNWLANPTSKVSAHIVINRFGKLYQIIPFNKVAWHAGKSEYGGRKNFNDFSIGIELDNAGYLRRTQEVFMSGYGNIYPSHEVLEARHRNENETRYWHTYTEEQVTACRELCFALIAAYSRINQILGHDEISPGRKQDPGPAFPMESFRNQILRNNTVSQS